MILTRVLALLFLEFQKGANVGGGRLGRVGFKNKRKASS